MAESATNTGNIVGKIDQHLGGNKSEDGYKYQYVNPEKNKKLGIITKDNVNHILYNLLWDIVSHQVDNDTAKGEMKEINWILKRYPKDDDRSDDTGVSNNTINKYVKKARDIINGMKEIVVEEVYVDNGKITKKSSPTAKKLNEEVDEDISTTNVANGNKLTYKKVHDNKGDHWQVFDSNGVLVATYESEELAKKAVQGKSLNEEYNPFKEMIKSDSEEWHSGLYTDGEGSFYEAPKSGTTKWQKKKNYQYRYNFGENQIEVADNSGDVIYSAYLSVGSWLDNPEYWFDKAYKDMEDEDEAFINEYFKKHPEADKRNISVKELKKEVNEEIGDDLLEKDNKFKYQMLSRLESDCKYFLGNGNRNERHLWAQDVDDHIKVMKKLYNSFDDEDKPEWIDLDAIESYYKDMKSDKEK